MATALEKNRMVQAALMISGKLIAELPEHQRTGWTIYLLEILDDGQEGYEQVLTDVIENIRKRLEKGEW